MSVAFNHNSSFVLFKDIISISFYMTDPFERKGFKARVKIGECPGIVGHYCSNFIAECFPPYFVVWPSHSVSEGLWFIVLFVIRTVDGEYFECRRWKDDDFIVDWPIWLRFR